MVACGPGSQEYHLCRAEPFLHFPGFRQAPGVGRVWAVMDVILLWRTLPFTYYLVPVPVPSGWNYRFRETPASALAPLRPLLPRGLRFLAGTVHRRCPFVRGVNHQRISPPSPVSVTSTLRPVPTRLLVHCRCLLHLVGPSLPASWSTAVRLLAGAGTAVGRIFMKVPSIY